MKINKHIKRWISVLCAIVLIVTTVLCEPGWFQIGTKGLEEVNAANTTPPTPFTEITWTDFTGVTCGEHINPGVDPSKGEKGTYVAGLNRTLLNGNIKLGANADIRYAGNGGWYGLQLRAWGEEGENHGKLLVNIAGLGTGTVEQTRYYAPESYGLTSFIDKEFNLKISTEISGDNYTFGIWINDKMVGDYFTVTAGTDENGTYMAGNDLGLFDNKAGTNITLSEISAELPEGFKEITWDDFTGVTCGEHINPGVDPSKGEKGTYAAGLNRTLLNGNIKLGANADIRYAGNGGWSGLILRAWGEEGENHGKLLVNIAGLGTGTVDVSRYYAPESYGLTSFIDKEFNLKISTEISGDNYTFGIWINDKMVGDYFTVTAGTDENGTYKAGNDLGLFDNKAGTNITLSEISAELPEGFKEITWDDFTGVTCGEHLNSGLNVTKGEKGTYAAGLNQTLLNGNIKLDSKAEIRYAGNTTNAWYGLIIRAWGEEGENHGKLLVNIADLGTGTVDVSRYYAPEDYGLTSFIDNEFNLKVSTEISENTYTFGIWVNNKMVGDYFTVTAGTDANGSKAGNDLGLVGNVTLSKMPPKTFREISWTDFAGVTYGEHVMPKVDSNAGTKGTYAAGLNRTLLNGNIKLGANADIRYAGNGGWSGLILRAWGEENENHGKLLVNIAGLGTGTVDVSRYYAPESYGLTNFIDEEFNLKISTEISGDNYTFGIWINDKMVGDYFTVTAGTDENGTYKAGNDLGLYDNEEKTNITLKPTDYTELRWTDFGNLTYQQYVAPNPDEGTKGSYMPGLHHTTLNGNIILGENTEIRYAGNNGWQGLVIRADVDEEAQTYGYLYITSNGLQAEGTEGYGEKFNPTDYELSSFINTEFNLKISTEISGDKYTFGIWINDKMVGDYITLTVDKTKVGNVLGLWHNNTNNNITLRKPVLNIPTNFTELRWADFTGLDYIKYDAPNAVNSHGTYSGNMDRTLLSGNIIMGVDTQLRYAGNTSQSGWWGLLIREADGKLKVENSTFETKYEKTYDAANYGLTSFANEEFNLKISTEVDGNTYRFGIWVNDKMLDDYFTLTAGYLEGTYTAGSTLGLYDNERGNSIILINDTVSVPQNYTELTWTDFAGLEYKEYVTPQGQYGTYANSLHETLFNGNIIMGSMTDIRYASPDSGAEAGWNGLLIRALEDGTLLINSSNFSTTYDRKYEPEIYGLTSFVGEEFNLKISTTIVDNQYTFGIWVNDKILGDYITLVTNDGKVGSSLGMAYEQSANNIVLKAAPKEPPVDFEQSDWADYEILTPLTSFGIAARAYELNYNDIVDKAPLSPSIEKFDKVVLQFHEIKFEGDADLGFGGENVWVGFRLRSNSTDGTLALQSGYSGAAGHNQLISTPIVMHDAVAGVDLVGGTYNLKISMVYINDTTIKMGIWFNDMLYNNSYIFIDISGMNAYEAGDVLGNHLGVVCQSEGGGTITLGEEEVTLKPVYWNMADGAYTVPSTTTDGDGNSIAELSTVGDYHITYTLNGKICDRDVYIWKIGDVKVDEKTEVRDLVRVKKIVQGQDVDTTNAGKEAADFDKNGTVDATDVHCMRRLLLGDTFDYGQTLSEKMLGVGKENVMPILGYYGPSAPWTIKAKDGISYTSKDTVTEEIYDLIAGTGINIITASNDAYSDANKELIEKHLDFAAERGLSLFVRDGRVDGSKEISHEELQYYLDGYAEHESFAGMFLVDEPKSDTYLEKHGGATLDAWAPLGKKVNQYGNLTGYVNLHPYYEDFERENNESTSRYKQYLKEYIEKFAPQYLSFDHYLFSSKKWSYSWFKWKKSTTSKNVDSSDYYVQNLAMVRNAANDAGIPFWSVVQAGSNWNDNVELLGKTNNTAPTQGQFHWQINMALAFGAKGITYFPMIQPHYFALTADGTMDYDRNGLIAEDGSTTVWYDYAVAANKQIVAIDEVLMNATNKGVIPVSGYAANIITNSLNDLGDANLVRSSYGELSSVFTTGTTYGAVVGCFDYNGKTALYVVNYDVNSSSDITLNFSSSVSADVTIGGEVSEMSGSSMKLSIGAGEGALVVLR